MIDKITYISIICVNYNSYYNLHKYLISISEAVLYEKELNLCVDVYIVDNSTKRERISTSYDNINIKIYNMENVGYFKAALHIVNKIRSKGIVKYKYICITNVDLCMDKTFFATIINKKYDEKIAWIAPSIFSYHENKDKNPATLHRRSLFKMEILKLLYRIPIIYMIYLKMIYKKKKRKKIQDDLLQIYAGHGSFIILTKLFLQKISNFKFPLFLYGEELFLAENIRLIGMKVYYDKTIKIYDYEHISTKYISKRNIAKYNIIALNYIIKEFYKKNGIGNNKKEVLN